MSLLVLCHRLVCIFALKWKFKSILQAGREVRQYFHRAEWSAALCHPEGGRQEGTDWRVRTWGFDWSGKGDDGKRGGTDGD